MRNVILGLGSAFGVLGFCAPAMAQQVLSPLGAQPVLSPLGAPTDRETILGASADLSYDSNVARSDKALADARGLKLADELATPDVDFLLARTFGRQVLFLKGDLGYEFHRVDTVLDREHIDVSGGLNAYFLRCEEVPSGSYTRQQSDLSEQSLGIVSNVQTTSTVGLAVDCGRPFGLAPQASVTQTWRDNSAIQYATTDSSALTFSGGMAYRTPALGQIALSGSYSTADYPNRIDDPLISSRSFGYKLYSGGITYTRNVGARIEGAAALYYTALDPNSALSPAFHGFTYALNLTYHASSNLALQVSAVRATTPSNRVDANYSIDETYTANVSYKLGTRLNLAIVGAYAKQDYRGNSLVLDFDLTKSTKESVNAILTYMISRRFSLALNVGDEERTANFPGLGYSSTRVGLTFRATY